MLDFEDKLFYVDPYKPCIKLMLILVDNPFNPVAISFLRLQIFLKTSLTVLLDFDDKLFCTLLVYFVDTSINTIKLFNKLFNVVKSTAYFLRFC